MNIQTSYQSTPALWQAYDADGYDDATDAKPESQRVGHGKTEREAINDLVEQIQEDAYAEGQKDGQEQVREAGDALARAVEDVCR